MALSRNRWISCLVAGALILTLIAAPWLGLSVGQAQGYSCDDYVYREDAQSSFQDPDACPDLPSRDSAPVEIATEIPTQIPAPDPAGPADGEGPGQGQEYKCSDYIYREDAQNGFQDPDACPELPSRSTAPSCSDFASQAEAQAFYNQDPYRYWTLTDAGRGYGTDSRTACPELAAGPAVVQPPVTGGSGTTPGTGSSTGTGGTGSTTRTGSGSGSSTGTRRVTVTAGEPVGSEAMIFAGTCDADAFVDPVAELTDVAAVAGSATGAGAFSTVATSFSTVDASLDDLLANEHVLVVFDEIQTERALSCGPIGGVIASDGSLAVGLREMPGAGWSGVAYLAPDAGTTSITIFLAEGLAAPND